MSNAAQVLKVLVANIKQLPKDRRAYWTSRLKSVADKTKSRELGEDFISEAMNSQWILDLANWLDAKSKKAAAELDSGTLAIANTLDDIYQSVAKEVKKLPSSAGKATGDFFGKVSGTSYWPLYVVLGLLGFYAIRKAT